MNIEKFELFFRNLKEKHIEECKSSAKKLIPNGRKMQPAGDIEPLMSGVLILCFPENGQIMLTVIRRTENDGVHSGQIAFPGGKFDEAAGDKNTCDTAIRETFEEIGVEVSSQQIIRPMTPLYIPPSNYLVDPYLAVLDVKPIFILNPDEVHEIIQIPLSSLTAEEAITESEFSTLYGKIFAPCYVYENVKIWGATAIMLSELVCLEKIRTGTL